MRSDTASRSVLCVAQIIGLASLAVARSAQASPDYPPALAAAIANQYPSAVKCVPLCTACHLTMLGGLGMLNSFGASLKNIGELVPGDANRVAPALMKLAATMPPVDSDGDGISDVDELIVGDSPSIAGNAGKNQFCPDIKYGCGARIAAVPPVDRLSLLCMGLAALGCVAGRRRRLERLGRSRR
jgi:hypothetical protein